MPLIHLAFGSHHRAGEIDQQVRAFVEHILLPRKLRSFVCPEFMPIINNPNALVANPNSARAIGDSGITFDEWVPAPPIGLLPNDVWMVSFVNIPFNKLRDWKPSRHYGRLGLAFRDEFRRRNQVRRVNYYQYPDLAKDPLVIALNRAISANNAGERERLSKLVVELRKPARLWREINDLFAVLKLTSRPTDGVAIEKLTYSRYEVGYDFEAEQESRLVTTEQHRDIAFAESEVLAIVVPDARVKAEIEYALIEHWEKMPTVVEYPR